MADTSVWVDHEWDPLVEVLVGHPHTRLGTRIPRLSVNYMPAATLDMAQQMLDVHAGRTLEEAFPQLHEMAVQQMEDAISILRGRGVRVHQIAGMEPDEEDYLSSLGFGNNSLYFPRDPVVVVGDRFVEAAMRFPMRRMERFAIRRTLADRVPGERVDALPEPFPLPEAEDGSFGPGPFLEGGDVLVLGQDVYVGVSGNASNSGGVRALQRVLGESRRVHEVPLRSGFLHLDCVLATPREGLAIVCRDGFPDGLPEFLREWDVIDVARQDAEEKLAVNVLVLDEGTVMVASETPEVGEALVAAGQDVVTTPFSALSIWGGSFRCWHQPLVRGDHPRPE